MKNDWDATSAKFQVPSMRHSKVELPKLHKLEGFGPPMSIKPAIEVEDKFPARSIDVRIEEVYFGIRYRIISQEWKIFLHCQESININNFCVLRPNSYDHVLYFYNVLMWICME